MFFALLVLVVAPLLELYILIQVAQVIGGWEAIALLLIMSVAGLLLLKMQGLATLARVTRAASEGRVPGKELVDGLLLLAAGAFLLAPGFIGDLIGFLLILPPTRAVARNVLIGRFRAGRYGTVLTGSFPGGARFVGTFGGGDVQDVTGRDTTGRGPDGHDRPQLDP
jgi:UPF0716 protein FxsA